MGIESVLLLACAFAQTPATEIPGIRLDPQDSTETLLEKAARVTPSARQLAWQDLEFAAFIHFGMNTFTDREWGEGTEDPKTFNPSELDAHQWVDACKAASMKMLILTAKHHDGFCLWPSAYTDHSVKNSPWKNGQGDVVREVADACRQGGIKFGFYLSPWDRHEPCYGDSPRYNEYYKNQLRELLTNYGDITDVWLDGACGEGPNGKRQEYDFAGYYALIRELQPNATISISGPDVRWCGNEAGKTRASEWSVIPILATDEQIKAGVFGCDAMAEDLGSRAVLQDAAKKSARLMWYPAQVDTSIRPGWFYHPKEDDKVRPLKDLLDIYYGSVGGNSQLLLNIPPDRRGRIHENDVARLKEIGKTLQAMFARNLAAGAAVSASPAGGSPEYTLDTDPNTCWTPGEGVTSAALEYTLLSPQTVQCALLQEFLPAGQRIEEVLLETEQNGEWKECARATTVGYKRLLRFDPVTVSKVRLRITQSRGGPALANFALFGDPGKLDPPAIARDANGIVSLMAPPDLELRYWLEQGKSPSSASKRYEGPFPCPQGGTLKTLAIPPDGWPGMPLISPAASAVLEPFVASLDPKSPTTEDKKAGWLTLQPDLAKETVQRTTDQYPLSDQQNKGQWEPYPPMSDEFDGDSLDPEKWYPNNPTWKGRQPGYFADTNVVVKNGCLQLSMRKEEPPEKLEGYHTYTSAAMQSKDRVRYGYFEVKARAMNSAGSSSFWFYHSTPDWWTEIDVFEIGGKSDGYERKLNMTLHVMHTPTVKEHFSVGGVFEAPFDLAADFHVYGLEWDEQELKFYLDGVLVRRGPNTDWHQPLTLNFDSETMPEWFGLPKDEDLPSTYNVEYLRAWKSKKTQ